MTDVFVGFHAYFYWGNGLTERRLYKSFGFKKLMLTAATTRLVLKIHLQIHTKNS
jgi:hypothetical protein